MSLPTLPSTSRRRLAGAAGIVVTVIAISALHYLTSLHSIVLHEIFKRLYYVPIVIAAVTAGSRGGLGTSVLSTLLYVPHVVQRSHIWPVLEVEQYGEVLLFNVVAIITGVLADRLRAERDRCRDAAAELRQAYAALELRTEERQRIDRLVTVGRIASGIAHEIRTPLASLLGCFEILEAEFPRGHPKAEFVEIAKREMSRLQRVVEEFLEFAQPATPTTQALDIRLVAEAAARLARPALARRGVSMDVRPPEAALTVDVDGEQIQRALLNIMLAGASLLRDGRIVLTIQERGQMGHIAIELDGPASLPAVADVFEPFPATGHTHGLALATARRLIENQQGTVRAEVLDARFRYLVDLPRASAHSTADPPRMSSLKKTG